jgi:hypothetical protein
VLRESGGALVSVGGKTRVAFSDPPNRAAEFTALQLAKAIAWARSGK